MADAAGERLDVFIARRLPELTRSRVQRLIAGGFVTVGDQRAKAALRLAGGERVRVEVPPPVDLAARPEPIPIDVVYEDGDLVAVNKPPGMAVHPSPGHPDATLVNAVLARCGDLSGIGGVLRPGIVHRLDRDTSGVILIAKTDATHTALTRQLRDRSVEKVYLALVEGTPTPAQGVIDAPIARDPRKRQRMAVVPYGRASESAYTVAERFRGASLVEVRPKTGRTHQIRVHLAAIGHPVVGDPVYGKPSALVARQFLHAWRIAFTHPRTRGRVELEAPLAPDLAEVLRRLRDGGAAGRIGRTKGANGGASGADARRR